MHRAKRGDPNTAPGGANRENSCVFGEGYLESAVEVCVRCGVEYVLYSAAYFIPRFSLFAPSDAAGGSALLLCAALREFNLKKHIATTPRPRPPHGAWPPVDRGPIRARARPLVSSSIVELLLVCVWVRNYVYMHVCVC